MKRKIIVFFAAITFFAALFVPLSASADTVTLAWDANTEVDLAGYKLYYNDTGAGEPYIGEGVDQGVSPIDIPLATLNDATAPSYTLTGLTRKTFIFTVTAYNADGLESEYSNTVRANFKPPAAPTGLKRIVEMIVGFLKRLVWFA